MDKLSQRRALRRKRCGNVLFRIPLREARRRLLRDAESASLQLRLGQCFPGRRFRYTHRRKSSSVKVERRRSSAFRLLLHRRYLKRCRPGSGVAA